MRPIDLAREHGLSTQAVRNYERDGVLPAAGRTASGYRVYTARHAGALRAFLALVPGHGHATAHAVMVAVTAGRRSDALELIDASHAALLDERRTLDAVGRALGDLTAPAGERSRGASRPGPVPVGALAHRLGRHPATLRRWERAGLLAPGRDASGARLYDADDVRDAHIVGQLRRGGHPLARIRPLLDELRPASDGTARDRDAGDVTAVVAALAERRAALDARARAMLHGAARLHEHLE